MYASINAEYMNEAQTYEARWEGEGMLKGLGRQSNRERQVRYSTATMLEHQELMNEQAPASATGADDIETFKRVSIAMVRRYFPQLIAHHTVGVQPLTTPAGFVYYMRFRAGVEKGDQPGIDVQGDVKYPDSGYDTTSLQQKTNGDTVIPIWYSHERNNREGATTATTSTTSVSNDTKTFALLKMPIKSDACTALPADATDIPGLTAGQKYTIFGQVKIGSVIQGYFRATGTTVTVSNVAGTGLATILSGTVDLDTSTVAFVFSAAPGTTSLANVSYHYDMECQKDLPRVTLVVESDTVRSETRKLRADWTIEAQQDLKASHNTDMEAEVTQFLSEQVNLEIDREIIEDLRSNAGTVNVWDFDAALGTTYKEKAESLYVNTFL